MRDGDIVLFVGAVDVPKDEAEVPDAFVDAVILARVQFLHDSLNIHGRLDTGDVLGGRKAVSGEQCHVLVLLQLGHDSVLQVLKLLLLQRRLIPQRLFPFA